MYIISLKYIDLYESILVRLDKVIYFKKALQLAIEF